MRLSLATDYVPDLDRACARLDGAAAIGFTHLHWCHHWDDPYHYTPADMRRVRAALRAAGMGLTDVHGALCQAADWRAREEPIRRAGVSLLRNRLRFAHELETDVVVMHPPLRAGRAGPMLRSLAEVEPEARRLGVRVALENLVSFAPLSAACDRFAPEVLGICYDSGHGNLVEGGLAQLAKLKDRVIAVHLHDNDGARDRHWLPFTGTVDWGGLMALLGASSYGKWINLEVSRRRSGLPGPAFLAASGDAGRRLDTLLQAGRAQNEDRACA